jgi:hypothetical protein
MYLNEKLFFVTALLKEKTFFVLLFFLTMPVYRSTVAGLKLVVTWLTLLLRIREVPGLILSPASGCPD